MKPEKYTVVHHPIGTILAWINAGEIALPEIQRPFVWKATQVRDLIDSLYKGYPIGYLIMWQNPSTRLKDGGKSLGKKILIDGQQRIIALKAAILGDAVINSNYKKVNIRIAFNPKENGGKFEVSNPAISKDPQWISDISVMFKPGFMPLVFLDDYCQKNPDMDKNDLQRIIADLNAILNRQIGIIELAYNLDIDAVTDIFIRVNSEGKVLSQADFAMSKIASEEKYEGHLLRKCIDYFSHLAVLPHFYQDIKENDTEFVKSNYFRHIEWLKDESDNLYDPKYSDILRVVFNYKFGRGKLSDMVSLLSGRDFETRDFKEEIAEQSFELLKEGLLEYVNEYNFKKFILIIKAAGFIGPHLIGSKVTLDFAYALYLTLKNRSNLNQGEIERYVQRWFVLSTLTGRYITSPETTMDKDIKIIRSRDFPSFIKETEEAELSDAFWNVGLVQSLETSSIFSPYYRVYLAAQVKANDKGLLSKNIQVREMIDISLVNTHHIFPKKYLMENGFNDRNLYNQVANFACIQDEINKAVGKKAPSVYFNEVKNQCNGGSVIYGSIKSINDLEENMKQNCIPESIFEMDASNYLDFLRQRRVLMAAKIRDYYLSL